jgi:PAS domain S-box-containing protein
VAGDEISNAESSVLVVGPERTMAPVTDAQADGETATLRFDHASGLDSARRVLAADSWDCVVVDATLLSEDDDRSENGSRFLDDVRALAPGCPVVLLTGGDVEPTEDLVAAATTIVDTSPGEESAFLLEKIRSTLQSTGSAVDGHRMYRTLVESARDGLYRLNAAGEIVYANESFAEMLGYTRSELLGSHGSRAMRDGELERGQRVIQRVMADDDRESDILDMEMTTKAGDPIVVAVHFVVLTTDDGAYDGVMGVVRDVTERRERERELERKNERLDSFASMVSHDLRNPLNVATGRLELVRETVEHDDLAEIDAALDRMDTLIEELLTLSRAGTGVSDLEAVSLASLAEECWQTVAGAASTFTVESALTIRADPNRVKQLFENLMRNAIEHGGAAVHVTVGDLDDGTGFYVADDGAGIPDAKRAHVFDAGYSTNEDGTGFGLAIVEDVAEAHGWSVAVRESESGGARFEISGVTVVST